jgi:hypothetical protein
MADKKSFFESINKDTQFDDEFYKKVYGYSVYDSGFLDMVTKKLIEIEEADKIQAYNDWFAKWEHEYLYGYIDANGKKKDGLLDVAHWYATVECPRQWEELKRKYRTINQEGSKKDWKRESKREQNQEQKADLLQRKRELLRKKLLESIGS